MNYEKIGQSIDDIRKARNWSKEALAKKTNSSVSTVHNHIKTGKMSLESLAKYAEVLGCTIGDLTEGTIDIADFHLDTDILSYWPYNLAVAVGFSTLNPNRPEEMEKARQLAHSVYVPALLESVETLTEREKKIIYLRFQTGLTYEQAGKYFGVTRERIRQIEMKALRKLRHPRHFKHWKMDTLDKAFEIAVERDRYRLENTELKNKLTRIMDAMGLKEEQKQVAMEAQAEEKKDIALEDLELSVRSYNCLKRAGIRSVADLDGWTIEKMMKIRNLGRRSLDEVLCRLKERGVTIPEGEE